MVPGGLGSRAGTENGQGSRWGSIRALELRLNFSLGFSGSLMTLLVVGTQSQEGQDREDSSVDRLVILEAKLGEDAANVFLNGAFTDKEGVGNRIVGSSLRHKRQHFLFALCQS